MGQPTGAKSSEIVITSEQIRIDIGKLERAVTLARECGFAELATEMEETLQLTRDILAVVEALPEPTDEGSPACSDYGSVCNHCTDCKPCP